MFISILSALFKQVPTNFEPPVLTLNLKKSNETRNMKYETNFGTFFYPLIDICL